MKFATGLRLIRLFCILAMLIAAPIVSAQSGKSNGKGKSGSSERSDRDRDDKDKDDDDDDRDDDRRSNGRSDRKDMEDRLGKIGEIVPSDKDKGKSDELPPGIEMILSDDKYKNAPPAWGVWKREERLDWYKRTEKEKDRLRDVPKLKKDFGEKDLDVSMKTFDSLTAMGVEPKDATSALNGLIEKGYRGDDLAGVFKNFSGSSSAVKSANDGGSGLGDLLRGQLDELLKGNGATLIDILDDGKINSPAPAPAATPLPAPPPASTPMPPIVTLPAPNQPPVGGIPAVSPVKDPTPVRAEKKGKVR